MLKKVPMRMCVVCKCSKPKKELIRIVKTENGFEVDNTQKLNGRGFYICNSESCLTLLEKQKILNKVFKCNIPKENYDKLKEQLIEYREN